MRDGESCLGQLTDAYLVDKYDKFVIRVHLHCGKVALLTAPGAELEGSVRQMMLQACMRWRTGVWRRSRAEAVCTACIFQVRQRWRISYLTTTASSRPW